MDELMKTFESTKSTEHEKPNKVVGVLSLHIKTLTLVDDYTGLTQSGQLRLKISICNDIKYMKYTIHEEKKRMVFDKIQHFPLELPEDTKDSSNQLIIQLSITSSLLIDHDTTLGTTQTHIHNIINESPCSAVCSLIDNSNIMIGTLYLDCGFNYGMFGFGESYQVHNSHYKPEEFLHWSLFPRVTPPEEHTDAKGLLTIPRGIQHPSFIPFGQHAHLCSSEDIVMGQKSLVTEQTKPLQLIKEMKRLSMWRLQCTAIRDRSKRLEFLENIMKPQNTPKTDEQLGLTLRNTPH